MINFDILDDINPHVIWCFNPVNIPSASTETYYRKKNVVAYELELVVDTKGGCQFIDGQEYCLKKGDLIFRKPGMVVEWFMHYYSYTIIFCLVHNGSDFFLNPHVVEAKNEYTSEVSKNFQEYEAFKSGSKFPLDFPIILNVSQFNEFERLFADAYSERTSCRQRSYLFSKTYLLQIFLLIYNELTLTTWKQNPSRSIRVNYQKILEAKDYIDKNIHLRFKLQELSYITGLSPSFFGRIFKKIIGCSPIDYINRSKINAIKNTLINTDKEIKEVLCEFGFEDESYFFKMFKKYQGTTPAAFRNKHQL